MKNKTKPPREAWRASHEKHSQRSCTYRKRLQWTHCMCNNCPKLVGYPEKSTYR